ncbi:MAG TPA: VOC family protein, partial [Ignavibacteria bacterium]|nr:VOC family protein [Ignavibacteria bacterium]
ITINHNEHKMKIPDNTKLQSAVLKVKDLKRSLNFYSHLMGFKIINQTEGTAELSASGKLPYILKLAEDKTAVYRHKGTTGLFHIAIRLPNKKELARVFLRLFKERVKFQGFSDHLVSEALYLADPDENGVELYADRPKDEWQYNMGQIVMDTLPLNLNVITDELDDRNVWNGIHPDTDIGHIHLNVSDLNKAQKFYSLLLGMNVTNSVYNGAMFFSAGGYHHHIGANVWSSRNGSPAPENTMGLLSYSIKIPDADYISEIQSRAAEAGLVIRDFDGKQLLLRDLDNIKINIIL